MESFYLSMNKASREDKIEYPPETSRLMKRLDLRIFIVFALSLSISPISAKPENSYISLLPRSQPVKSPIKKVSTPQTQAKKGPLEQPGAEKKAGLLPTGEGEHPEESTEQAAPSWFSPSVEQAVRQFKSNPTDISFSQILEALKPVLTHPSAFRSHAAVIIKDNPSLQEFKPRVIETSTVRVWTFPKSPQKNQVIIQWLDIKQSIVALPRHKKKTVATATVRAQTILLPEFVNIKDAGFIANKDGQRFLILSGEGEDGSLWVDGYSALEGVWTENPGYINSLPTILVKNVSGHITFRNPDMIFNVARMVQTVDSTGTPRSLPEAESSTYQFWLKLTDSGYFIVPNLPDEEAFRTVQQFVQAIQQGRSDIAKSLLSDARLVSIFKYLGLIGKPLDPGTRVVQMSLPPSKGQRFRLFNMGKDELIFDVGKVKGIPLIKAVFIAPPDPFLQETGKYFPLYGKLTAPAPQDEKPSPTGSSENQAKKKA